MIPSPARKAFIFGGLLLGCLNGAQGAVTVLDFEGLANLAPVEDFYNGGGGGALGVSFLSDMVVYGTQGHSGTNGVFSFGPASIMNVAEGFTTGFSFYYASGFVEGASVSVYSGLNGSGDVLGVIAVASLVPDWEAVGVSFAGVARSVSFVNASNTVFDDVTLGSATPGAQQVPEPSTYAALVGTVALAAVALRRRVRGDR